MRGAISMKNELRQIADEAWRIALDAKSSRIEKLEALKLVAAVKGVLLPDVNEQWLTVRQVCQLRRAKQELVQKVLRRKARRKVENQRARLRRQIRELRTQEQEKQ
jgi:hypothetical protein